jgi:hypothetical protein
VPLTIYAFHEHPKAFPVTKVGAPIGECPFILDFSRPLSKHRWLGVRNRWVGFVTAFGVPIVHIGQEKGELEMLVLRADPYFKDVKNLWRAHFPSRYAPPQQVADGLDVVADFGRHFPAGC